MEAHRAPLGPRVLRRWPRPLKPAGDDRLARLTAGGSEEAFGILYDRYCQRLYRYCRSMLGNDADAQDALQSAFAGAFAALADGRRDAPVRPWLYRIAHNEAVNVLRRRRPEVDLDQIEAPVSPSAADVVVERERLAGVVEDLRRLTERQRSALVMRELSGLSHDEIGVALDTDSSGAKQTIFEARRSLQEFAEGRDMQCDEVCRAISAGGGRTLRARKIRSHLHECSPCRAFAAAIPSRSRDLRAIAPPLAAAAATGIFRRALSSTGHGGGGAGLAGATGKAVALSVVGKTIAGAAVVATVAAGAAGVAPILSPAQHGSRLTSGRSVTAPAANLAAPLRTVREPSSLSLSHHHADRGQSAPRSYGARGHHHHAVGAGTMAKRAHEAPGRLGPARARSTAPGRGSARLRATRRQPATGVKPSQSTSHSTTHPPASGRSSASSTHPVNNTTAPAAGSATTRTPGTSAAGRTLATTVKAPAQGKSLH